MSQSWLANQKEIDKSGSRYDFYIHDLVLNRIQRCLGAVIQAQLIEDVLLC